MLDLVRNKLAVRQASYSVAVIVVIASLISLVETYQLYSAERENLSNTLNQQINMASGAASRAAFHVDKIQAKTALDGLFQFENLEWARISTDLGQIIAEHHRTVHFSYTDRLAHFLFDDLIFVQRDLFDNSDLEAQSTNSNKKIVGKIELRASPEIAGETFFAGAVTLVTGLMFQFILLGVTLAIVFHRSLTLPLLSYADAISKLVAAPAGIHRLTTPKGHEHDELGNVVKRTNELLERINSQHQDILHREKIATLGTLLAGVSHELNNPLSILAVQSELLVETSTDANTRKRGEKIHAMANRCGVIVKRFLALAHRRDVQKEQVDVGGIIREVLDILDYQIIQAGIETRVIIPSKLPLVFADKSQITQVLLNLVVNAEQAVLENTAERQISAEAEVQQQGSVIRISISDNGPGIQAENIEQIFEPFYTTKREGQGTGLGLSYAREVVRDHGGDLTAEINPNGGAKFIIVLPAISDKITGIIDQ